MDPCFVCCCGRDLTRYLFTLAAFEPASFMPSFEGNLGVRHPMPLDADTPNRTRVFRIELGVESYQVRDILKGTLNWSNLSTL